MTAREASNVTGAERIAAAFAGEKNRSALMPYLMGGFPTVEQAGEIAQAYVDGGATLIEFGLPFSDPLADGPVIHAAAVQALAAGSTTDAILETVGPIASQLPVMLMTYVNVIEARGREAFLSRLAALSVSGLIVPDLPHEEAAAMLEICDRNGIALIPLVAPTSTDERLKAICADARGFIYTVSVTGTTGERAAPAAGLEDLVARIRANTDLPVAVGFGIGDPQRASEVAEFADGVIVGTRLVREVSDTAAAGGDPVAAAGELVRGFAAAIV